VSHKIFLLDALSPIEWSQAAWRLEGPAVETADCAQELIHRVMLEHLPKDGLIADAGCGSAKWPIYLRRLGYRVIGFDISREACAQARAADSELGVAVGDVRTLPVQSHSLDAVLSLGVVEHDEEGPLAALREAHRVLKPNGLLILSVPYDNLWRRLVVNWLQAFVTWRRRRRMRLGFVEYRFTEPEVRDFLTATGFDTLSSHPNDYLPPRTVGPWVDYQNLTFSPFVPPTRDQLFLLPGLKGRLAVALLRLSPWIACGEVTVVARARAESVVSGGRGGRGGGGGPGSRPRGRAGTP
jgi:SAM-dependent methyltransferase